MVNAFFKNNKELNTGEDRRTCTKDGLKDLRFLYSNTSAENPQVLHIIAHD